MISYGMETICVRGLQLRQTLPAYMKNSIYFPERLQNENQKLESLWLSVPSVPILYPIIGFFIT